MRLAFVSRFFPLALAASGLLGACQAPPPASPEGAEAEQPAIATTATSPAAAVSSSKPSAPPPENAEAGASPAPAAPARAPTVEWARRWGGVRDDVPGGLLLTSDGSFILAGRFSHQIDLGGKKLEQDSNNNGAFVARFEPDARLRWVTDFHTKQNEYIRDIALGPDDTTLFMGYFREMDAGCGKIRSKDGDDILLGALDAKGRCKWTHGHGAKKNDMGQAITVDGAGNIGLFGVIQSGADLGGGPIDTGGKQDIFFAGYTKAGEHRWSRRLKSTAFTAATAAAVDAEGTTYVAVIFKETVDLGNGPVSATAANGYAIAALGLDGQLKWSTPFSGSKFVTTTGLNVDPRSGDIIAVGMYAEGLDIGKDHLTSAGGYDGFIARFDKTGKIKWAKSYGSPENDGFYRAMFDAAGNLCVVGEASASFAFGETELRGAGREDALVASVNPDGSPRWALSFGGPEHDAASKVVIDPSGRILVTGSFSTSASFGGTNLDAVGGDDIFMVALRP